MSVEGRRRFVAVLGAGTPKADIAPVNIPRATTPYCGRRGGVGRRRSNKRGGLGVGSTGAAAGTDVLGTKGELASLLCDRVRLPGRCVDEELRMARLRLAASYVIIRPFHPLFLESRVP